MRISTSRIGVLGLAATAMLVGGGAAQAGILAVSSGGALPGFTGTQFFDDDFFGFTVSANVDYAVFAPGTFPFADPSGGSDYVYAYQIDNLDTNIVQFTVGLDGDETLGSIGSIPDGASTNPDVSAYVGAGPTSAAWDFTGFGSAQTSDVLFFTSAQAPELHSSTVSAQWANSHDLPSPLPEPATLSLLALGAAVSFTGRRRK